MHHFDASMLQSVTDHFVSGGSSVETFLGQLEKAPKPSDADDSDLLEVPPTAEETPKAQQAGKDPKDAQDPAEQSLEEDLSDDEENPGEDPFAWARTLYPTISLLPPGSHGKRLPYRCNLCKTRTWPQGKVGELSKPKKKSIKHFIKQHLKSSAHQRRVREMHKLEAPPVPDRQLVPCEGLGVDDPQVSGALLKYSREFSIWAPMTSSKFQKNIYYKDDSGGWCCRASNCSEMCQRVATRERQVCEECLKLGSGHGVVRTLRRFAMKYYAAKLLNARVFLGHEETRAVQDEITSSQLHIDNKQNVNKLMTLKTCELQQFVRHCFLSANENCKNEVFDSFVATVVKPALRCATENIPETLMEVASRFSVCLSSGEASEQDLLNMKLAAASLSGKLEAHPLIQGLSLQVYRRMEQRERGVEEGRGRRSHETELEKSLIAEAGIQLAAAAGNPSLVKLFGMSTKNVSLNLDQLHSMSLPRPALAMKYPEVLKENFNLINQRFLPAPQASKRAKDLMYLFDPFCFT